MSRFRVALTAALVGLLPLGSLVAAGPAHAGFQSVISGRVSGPDVGRIEVDLLRLTDGSWDSFGSEEPDAEGDYIFARLPAGSYRVEAKYASTPPDEAVPAPQWYGGQRFDSATTIVLSRGEVERDIDVTLGVAATVTGRLVASGSEWPLEGSAVVADPVEDTGHNYGASAYVRADGTFTLHGLGPGDYLLRGVPPENSDLARTVTPTPLTLSSGQSASGVTVSVGPAAGFGGRVTAGGEPIEFAVVNAYRMVDGTPVYEDYRYTDSGGWYFFAGLPRGRYVVTASPEEPEWGSAQVDGVVLDGETPPDVPMQLPQAGHITGTVFGPDGEPVGGVSVLLEWQGAPVPGWSVGVVTDQDGHFSADSLVAGTYVPRLRPSGSSDHLPVSGSAVTVPAGGTSATSLVAPRAGRISGTVTGQTGRPLGNVEVHAYRWFEEDWWLEDLASSAGGTGAYTLSGLTPGTYRVCFRRYVNGGATVYYGECYDNVPSDEVLADDLAVAANQVLTGIDAQLDPDGVALDNLTAPAVSGTPAVGSTLTTTPGSWSPQPESFVYRWYRDDEPVSGAAGSGQSYVLTNADSGAEVYVRVTALAEGYRATHAFSDPVDVQQAPITNVRRPTISGTAEVGRTLTGGKGTWVNGSTLTYRYAWIVGGAVVRDASRTTLRLTRAMTGKKVVFRVTASRSGARAVTAKSAATRRVAR